MGKILSKLNFNTIESKNRKIYKDYIISNTVLGIGKLKNDVLLIEKIKSKGQKFALKILAYKVCVLMAKSSWLLIESFELN